METTTTALQYDELYKSGECATLMGGTASLVDHVSILTVGLLSDTHIPRRLKRLPDAALDALAGVDLILHAGDVDDPAALEPLRAIAPVHGVRGNVHLQDFSDGGASLPATVELELAGKRVVLVHGHWPGPIGFCFKGLHMVAQWLRLVDNGHLNRQAARRLARLYSTADVIVFGNSHRAHVERVGRALLVNPGAVCPTRRERPTVARMRLVAGRPEVEIVPLPK
ncbi:MAG: YfcE family phosphodiesterase [Chloroflexi bacterium]|nr:YfcE family phosphodiesterase [Chloroflexota bacterium]